MPGAQRVPLLTVGPTVEKLTLGAIGLFISGAAAAVETVSDAMAARQFPVAQVFTFLFLMIGPIKIFGPFAQNTKGADPAFVRQVAIRATAFASAALLIAAFLGERMLRSYGIPLAYLGLAGGLIFFLVALRSILEQFTPHPQDTGALPQPSLKIALTPLAFPTIVTPYGIAVLVIFLAFSETLEAKLEIGVVVVVIMLLNLLVMLVTRHVMPVLAVVLPILGAVIGVVQVALGLQIMNNALRSLGVT